MPQIDLSFESGEESLSVRRFSVREAVSELFEVAVWAVSPHPDLDLESLLGRPAALHVASGWFSALLGGGRRWSGVVSHIELVQAEPTGVSTYHVRIVPVLWLLTQRKNLRIFQHASIPDIVSSLLAEWGIAAEWQIDRGAYPDLEYKVQYGETDFAFVARLLEEAGIAFVLDDEPDAGSRLIFSDHLHTNDIRPGPPIPYVDNPSRVQNQEFVTHLRLTEQVRPTQVTLRDHDFRNPAFPLGAEAVTPGADQRLSHYVHRPGSFLSETEDAPGTPHADDLGFARSDPRVGKTRAEVMLGAERARARLVSFSANAVDLRPGVVLCIADYPHPALGDAERLLVTETLGEGSVDGPWTISCRAAFASLPFRPLPANPRPRASGVENAFVVGPPGQEIYTDEFGRVRVQFPWDREGKTDPKSSVWMRVSQGWAGTGFGIVTIPRVGQEVLVGFLDGNPEQPIVVGRVFNAKNRLPYKLPDLKMVSTWKSESTPGGGGYNEIVLDDTKGLERFGIRAERDLRKLVKRDETSTVGRHKKTLVKGDEVETTKGDHVTYVGKDRKVLVEGDETDITQGNVRVRVGKDKHVRVVEALREQVDKDLHVTVGGSAKERVEKTYSLTVEKDHFEKVGGRYAVEVAKELHVKTGSHLVIEAQDITVKGPGGFVRVDAGGVTIKGTLVKINSAGGSPGEGGGAAPEAPEPPEKAEMEIPEMDDVAKSGHSP